VGRQTNSRMVGVTLKNCQVIQYSGHLSDLMQGYWCTIKGPNHHRDVSVASVKRRFSITAENPMLTGHQTGK
jgi:hypothetical protein